MNELRNICVYCGSSPGNDPAFSTAAERLGQILAEQQIGLVYGGGTRGLMGALAQSVYAYGGTITGVIPEFLKQQELLFEDAQEIIVTRDMHERKRIMYERADAFVALPGGIGTLEELVEQLTWAQLGHHEKPVVLADVNGYWRPLLKLFATMEECEFIHRPRLLSYEVCADVDAVVPTIRAKVAAKRRPAADETLVVERM